MIQIFEKIFKVIMSCETMTQLEMAYIYLCLAYENGFISEELMKAIYFSIYLSKYNELNKN